MLCNVYTPVVLIINALKLLEHVQKYLAVLCKLGR